MKSLKAALLLLLLLAVSSLSVRGQSAPLADERDAIPFTTSGDLQPAQITPAAPASYAIGPGDLLAIYVLQMPEMNRQIRVSAGGAISLPFIAKPFDVNGKTADAVASDIEGRLVADGIARHPAVEVTVRDVESRPITVAGAVNQPRVIQAYRPFTLMEVIARAGGPSKLASDKILLSQPEQGGLQTRVLSLNALMQGTDPAVNPLLEGGEEIRLLPAVPVYATGALHRPGAFLPQSGEAITVLRVIAMAEGMQEPSDKQHAEIIRRSTGHLQQIPINLEAILHHKAEDVELQPGDILYVPVNHRRSALNQILSDAGSAAVIAIGYGVTR